MFGRLVPGHKGILSFAPSVTVPSTTWRHMPLHLNLQQRHCEILKSLKFFSVLCHSSQVSGSSELPNHYFQKIPPEVNRTEREDDHRYSFNVEVENEWNFTSSTKRVFRSVAFMHRTGTCLLTTPTDKSSATK